MTLYVCVSVCQRKALSKAFGGVNGREETGKGGTVEQGNGRAGQGGSRWERCIEGRKDNA